jgi:DNA (cytosine-5)-methyltransferase 1
MNYYNEFDPKAAAWLRELIKDGLIPDGEVDERSITMYEQMTFEDLPNVIFRGVGGWSLALQMAGIQENFPCWTGTVPASHIAMQGNAKN